MKPRISADASVTPAPDGDPWGPEVSRTYRKRPVEVQAWRTPEDLEIETLEGTMRVPTGWWVITGVEGEVYGCKNSVFRATYEPGQ
jgi:hypothetical protein